MKFLVDFDSVVFDLNKGQLALINAKFGTDLTEDHILSWAWEESGHFTPEMVDFIWGEEVFLNPAFHATCDPIVDALDGLRFLQDNGYEPHIVTDRPTALGQSVIDWLGRHGFDIPVIVTNRRGYTKLDAARDFGLTSVIEDAPHAVPLLADHVEDFWLIDRPYNRMVEHPNVIRVEGWKPIIRSLGF